MKNFTQFSRLSILLTAFLLTNNISQGQTIDNINNEFCIVEIMQKTFSGQFYLKMDMGNAEKPGYTQIYVDDNNKEKMFNSIAEVLNSMYRIGCRYVNNYTMLSSTDQGNTVYFVFERVE